MTDPRKRVTPDGSLIAASGRDCLMMGNRGTLRPIHYTRTPPAEPSQNWIACVIKDKDGIPIRENPDRPLKYTKLFFLDEVTAFAAGHRPCGGCQHQRYKDFKAAWATANNMPKELMDPTIRGECLSKNSEGERPVVVAKLGDLPGGTMVRPTHLGAPHLWFSGKLLPWSASGYGQSAGSPASAEVEVITPMSIVRVLQAGFPLDKEYSIHESALAEVA